MKNKYVIISVLLILFIIDAILVASNKIVIFDNYLYELVRSIECGFFDSYFKFFTKFANATSIIILIATLNIFLSKINSLKANILALTSVGTNTIIKNIFKRTRPNVLKLIKQGGYSFPSGHSMISITLYGFLIYLVHIKIRNKFVRILLEFMLGFLIINICISRVYVGVHYASDVLGGLALGSAELLFVLGLRYDFSGGKDCVQSFN